jgi:hypothetical protein
MPRMKMQESVFQRGLVHVRESETIDTKPAAIYKRVVHNNFGSVADTSDGYQYTYRKNQMTEYLEDVVILCCAAASPKRWFLLTSLHDFTTQNNIVILTTVRI